MKANEMPERIYIFDYNDAMVTPLEGDTVYVREDAFIEKVCEWLKNNLQGIVGGSIYSECITKVNALNWSEINKKESNQ